MEFSIKLAKWVLDDPVLHFKKYIYGLKMLYFTSILKQTCFFPLWPPPLTHPSTHPLDYRLGTISTIVFNVMLGMQHTMYLIGSNIDIDIDIDWEVKGVS